MSDNDKELEIQEQYNKRFLGNLDVPDEKKRRKLEEYGAQVDRCKALLKKNSATGKSSDRFSKYSGILI